MSHLFQIGASNAKKALEYGVALGVLSVVFGVACSTPGCIGGSLGDDDGFEQLGPGVFSQPASAGTYRVTMEVEGTAGAARQYVLHVPESAPPEVGWPTVFAFHGGGGQAESMLDETGWDELADEEGFAVVLPEGTRPHPDRPPRFGGNSQTWNDGTERTELGAVSRGEDDIEYVDAVIDDVKRRVDVDTSRLYSSGFSNGGSMAFYLARERPDTWTAIAPFASRDVDEQQPELDGALSMLYTTGTEDPLNPVDGGEVYIGQRHYGYSPPVGEQFQRWLSALDCPETSRSVEIGETTADEYVDSCREGHRVGLILIDGHGHHWPGGNSMLWEGDLAGPDTADIDLTEVIWAFFNDVEARGSIQ